MSSVPQTQRPEIAHVLFIDLVGYSKLSMNVQSQRMDRLEDVVRTTTDFKSAQKNEQLICLSTGDGMALVFFGDPEAPPRCALEIFAKLSNDPNLKLRMGIHSGPVYRVDDINLNRNVRGGGINVAQRVMDSGDAGHILMSERVAGDLLQLGHWDHLLHDLGWATVKHGLKIRVYNLYDEKRGNPKKPSGFSSIRSTERIAEKKPTSQLSKEKQQETLRRRYLSLARQGMPHPLVVESVASHLLSPDPEVLSIMDLPPTLASLLELRQTFIFRQNATQAIRDALEAALFHEMCHRSRPGEEGAHVARILRSDPKPFDLEIGQLVYSDLDHPAVRHVARTTWPSKSTPREAPLSELVFSCGERITTEQILDRYLHVMESLNVSAVIVPHVVWVNGAKLDVRKICKGIRSAHPLATTIVDGAQAVGHVSLDIEQVNEENLNIDFYVGCGHKWLCGPEAIGFARVGRRYDIECERCHEFLAVNDQLTDASGLPIHNKSEQTGTNQRGLAKGFLEAIRLLQNRAGGLGRVQASMRKNADAVRTIISRFPCLILLDPPSNMKSAIVSFTTTPSEEGFVESFARQLKQHGFNAALYSLPAHHDPAMVGRIFLRLSPGPDLTKHDLNKLTSLFKEAL